MFKTLCCAALLLAVQPRLLAAETPPRPPDLSQAAGLPAAQPSAAASQPAAAAPQRRRLTQPDDGRVRVREDELTRTEEHLDARGRVLRIVVHPKNGAPAYEMAPPRPQDELAQIGPRRWKLLDF